MPPQRLDWAAKGFGWRQTVRAGEPSGGAALDSPAGSGPPAILSLHAASPGSEGEAATGDGRTGSPRRRGSDALQRFGAAAEGLAGRPLPRREPRGTFAARPTDGAGDAALPGSSGMTGRAQRSGGRRSRHGEGPLRSLGGGEGIKGEERQQLGELWDRRQKEGCAERGWGAEGEGELSNKMNTP
uniref:Uncharacterized protein n=1 Tax=Sphaerodactylus townsendi TaxID=933632 RepID=A0ACB8FHL2_9SAUR